MPVVGGASESGGSMRESLNLEFTQALASQSGAIYVTLQLLGTGGNAETYLVLATSGPHRGLLFALKIFRRLSKPEWRTSFLQEIAFLRGCSHPAIMRVFDEGLHLGEHPFVVVEYLPQTLADVLRSRTSLLDKLTYAVQLLAALEYLAGPALSVVHRDVKPQNIFLKGGSCVLGDFGLVKRYEPGTAADRQLLKESAGQGMPRFYRTPDLVAYLRGGPPPTPKSDVFQLGLVLAEMFTGENPVVAIHEDDFAAPVELRPLSEIPGELGEPIAGQLQQMLAVDPGPRPSAAEMLARWQELFLEVAGRVRAFEGRVF